MCENILKTLVAEPLAKQIESDRRKLPGIQTWHLGLPSLLHFLIVAVHSNGGLCPSYACLYSRIMCLADATKFEEKKQLREEENRLWLCSDVGVLN